MADRLTVAVPGGGLVVHELTRPQPDGADVPTVVAVHGITANALAWAPVAQELERRRPVRVLAPDVRGRACSRAVGPPYGLPTDAADLVAMLRSVTRAPAGSTVVVGHSMGAFVAALAAAGEPALLPRVVLVDGGLAFPAPPSLDIDAALSALIGPSMQRLTMQFPDEEAYLGFWERHPAMGPLMSGPHADAVRRYLAHDLVPAADAPGQLRSSCVLEAIRSDGAGLLDDRVHRAVTTAAGHGVRMELLWAQRGLMDEPQGIYDADRLAGLAVPASVRLTAVADSNHFSVLLAPHGVAAVVDAIDRALAV